MAIKASRRRIERAERRDHTGKRDVIGIEGLGGEQAWDVRSWDAVASPVIVLLFFVRGWEKRAMGGLIEEVEPSRRSILL